MEDFKKIKEFTGKIRLNDAEKAHLRGNILRAVRSESVVRHIYQRANIFELLTLNFKPMMVGLSFVVALAVSVSTGFAAEQSLPGDLLYSVKTGVNERISEVLAFSTEAKAEVEANISDRRLEEAARLVQENRFSGQNQADIEANFERHSNKVEKHLETLEVEGKSETAADIRVKFQTSLDARVRILEKLDGRAMEDFLPKIEAKGRSVTSLKVDGESRIKLRNKTRNEGGNASTTLEVESGQKNELKVENDKDDKKEGRQAGEGADVDNEADLKFKLRFGL